MTEENSDWIIPNEKDPMIELAMRIWNEKCELDEREEKLDKMKQELADMMRAQNITTIPLNLFSVNLKKNIKYLMPSPEVVTQYLGEKLAKQFIKVAVSQEFRTAIPPDKAVELCPKISETEYIEVRKRK